MLHMFLCFYCEFCSSNFKYVLNRSILSYVKTTYFRKSTYFMQEPQK